jgi:hypothetical protein
VPDRHTSSGRALEPQHCGRKGCDSADTCHEDVDRDELNAKLDEVDAMLDDIEDVLNKEANEAIAAMDEIDDVTIYAPDLDDMVADFFKRRPCGCHG